MFSYLKHISRSVISIITIDIIMIHLWLYEVNYNNYLKNANTKKYNIFLQFYILQMI